MVYCPSGSMGSISEPPVGISDDSTKADCSIQVDTEADHSSTSAVEAEGDTGVDSTSSSGNGFSLKSLARIRFSF